MNSARSPSVVRSTIRVNSSGDVAQRAVGSTTASRSLPSLKTAQTIRPSGRKAYQDCPKTHSGPPISASSAVTGS